MSDIPRHITTSLPKALTAIRAVLELHGPVENGVSDLYWKEPDYCPTCCEYWPCETYRAVKAAVEGEHEMTRTYTAADFANAKFAKHPETGRIAARFNIDPEFPWTFNRGYHTDEYKDVGMAHNGWVPVSTKPTITENQVNKELADETKDFEAGFHYALAVLETEIIPDPEPTNTDRLESALAGVWGGFQTPGDLAKWLNDQGITAPNVKGN